VDWVVRWLAWSILAGEFSGEVGRVVCDGRSWGWGGELNHI
jgi:hypothetical protein